MLGRKLSDARKGNLLMSVRTPAVSSKVPQNASRDNLHKLERELPDVSKQI
jgi:hypothetical protein